MAMCVYLIYHNIWNSHLEDLDVQAGGERPIPSVLFVIQKKDTLLETL